MHIALVTETFSPEVNGVARTLRELVRGLVARGHSVEVVRPWHLQAPAPEGWSEFTVRGLPLPGYPGLQFGLPAPHRLLRHWSAGAGGPGSARPDIVHIATEGPLGLSALWAARRCGPSSAGLPVSSTFHTNFHDYGAFYGFGPLRRVALGYLRWFHERTRTTLVPGPDIVARLAEQGFPRLGVLARGVDREQFHPARRSEALRREWGVSPDQPVALFVSRLAQEKNPRVALEGFRVLRALDPRWRAVVVGDGPAAEAMRRAAPDALFCGMQSGDDLAAHYASGDLLLFPSRTETFGNVLLEGMACGVAPLAFDTAAASQIVTKTPGGLGGAAAAIDGWTVPLAVDLEAAGLETADFETADFEAADRRFLDAVREVGDLPLETIRGVGRRAAQTAESWTWERIVDRFESVLSRLVEEGVDPLRRAPTYPQPTPERLGR